MGGGGGEPRVGRPCVVRLARMRARSRHGCVYLVWEREKEKAFSLSLGESFA
jgi:hypothetical protein